MARTALTAQQFTVAGLAPTYVTPDATGVTFRNSRRCVLHVKNGSGSSINVTPKIGRTVLGKAVGVADAVAVAAGGDKFIGPYNSGDWNQEDGKDTMFVDFSAVTTVTVALLELP